MNDHELAEIFSDVFDLVKLKDGLFGAALTGNLSQDEIFLKFSKILSLSGAERGSAKELNKIMALLPNFGFFKNIFSEYLWCTPMYAKKMGFDHPEDLIGKSDLYFPWSFEMASCYQEADELVLLTGEATHRKEQWIFEGQNNIQENIIAEMHRYPVFDRQGHVIGVFGVGRADVAATQLAKMAHQSSQESNQASSNQALVQKSGHLKRKAVA